MSASRSRVRPFPSPRAAYARTSNRDIIVWRKIDAIAPSARSASSITRVAGSSSRSISRSTASSCANVEGTSASASPVWYERDDVAQLVGVVHEDVREHGLRDRVAVRAADLAGTRLRVDVGAVETGAKM